MVWCTDCTDILDCRLKFQGAQEELFLVLLLILASLEQVQYHAVIPLAFTHWCIVYMPTNRSYVILQNPTTNWNGSDDGTYYKPGSAPHLMALHPAVVENISLKNRKNINLMSKAGGVVASFTNNGALHSRGIVKSKHVFLTRSRNSVKRFITTTRQPPTSVLR